jgi:thioredoxin-related protein
MCRYIHRSFFLCALLLAASCDNTNETAQTSTEQASTELSSEKQLSTEVPVLDRAAAIEWYDGNLEEAFALGKETSTPLFLYWGAIWCPPCQEIKHTVFKSPQFIDLTKLFIPIYLDGDTQRAQAWGENFGVQGYPTMIVFSPDGEEVTRIPGGIDVTRYNTVLELSLNQMRSTATLVELALANPGNAEILSDDEYYQLAYYSWGQDSLAIGEGTDEVALFYGLSQTAPAGELSARFYMNYLVALFERAEVERTEAERVEIDAAKSEESNKQIGVAIEVEVALGAGGEFDRLVEILSDKSLVLACWDTLAYYAEEIQSLPVFAEAQKSALEQRWAQSVFEHRFDDTLSTAEKMAGWLPLLYSLTKSDQSISAEESTLLSTELQAMDRSTPDSYERQSVINQMASVYRKARLNDRARELLLSELEKSSAAYYFMSGLGSYAEKDEQFIEALQWRKRAYEASIGEATRFQWGSNYLLAMIRMSPEEESAILQQADQLLTEFKEANQMFSGRNFTVLRRTMTKLNEWGELNESTTVPFSDQVESLCDAQEGTSQEAHNCRSLFGPDAVASA